MHNRKLTNDECMEVQQKMSDALIALWAGCLLLMTVGNGQGIVSGEIWMVEEYKKELRKRDKE